MKVTLTHDGKSVELDLTNEQLTTLGLKEEKKKTGYERGKKGDMYYHACDNGNILVEVDAAGLMSDRFYATANYYTERSLAVDNARADRLMRQLRRFAAENGGIPSVEDWHDTLIVQRCIKYDYDYNSLVIDKVFSRERHMGNVYFNSEAACIKACEQFRDELLWYFTEYEATL